MQNPWIFDCKDVVNPSRLIQEILTFGNVDILSPQICLNFLNGFIKVNLVTGGAGLGSHLIDYLLSLGEEVIV